MGRTEKLRTEKLEELKVQWSKAREASIKKLLKATLAEHKLASEADPVRESEERTKKELADMQKQLAELAAAQQKILEILQS